MAKVRKEHFNSLEKARIKLLFDTKMRKQGTGIILAQIHKPGELLKFFMIEADRDAVAAFNYVVTIDKAAWGAAEEEDRVKLIRHELRHAFHDSDALDPWKLITHDVLDFRVELEMNADDMFWGNRVAAAARKIYDAEHPKQERLRGANVPKTKPKTKTRKGPGLQVVP
jgi:hypothetical protein